MSRLPSALKSLVRHVALPAGTRPYRIRSGALKGKSFYLNLRDDTQVWRGVYEQDVQRWVERVVARDSVCFDVGAAEGWVTLQMALRATRGEVHAFEPSERGDWIAKNLQLNDSAPQAKTRVRRELVGEADSEAAGPGPSMIGLDSYVAGLGLSRVDVVKIDVDGPELEVLDGAAELLRDFRPQVCVEAHSRPLLQGVLERLERAGYASRVVDAPAHEHRPIAFNPTVFASWGKEP